MPPRSQANGFCECQDCELLAKGEGHLAIGSIQTSGACSRFVSAAVVNCPDKEAIGKKSLTISGNSPSLCKSR